MSNKTTRLLLAGSVLAIAGVPGAALAQTAAPEAPAAGQDAGSVGDIIVTAQRRDESLSRTPVAVSVLSADTLARSQITSQQDLRVASPGLSIRASLNSNQLNYAIRGQSQDPLSDTAPGVVPYINEVQISGTAGASAFYDLQSVQVLKGPQGTLFGRSATGGAVLFSTTKPGNEVAGYISATGGNYNYQKAEGALNIPFVKDRVLFRVAAVYQKQNGFQTNLFTNGGREGDNERYGVRPSLTINFSDSFHNELVVDYLHTSGSSTVSVIGGLVPFTGAPGQPPFVPIEFLYAGTATPTATFTGQCTVQAFAQFPGPCPPVNPAVAGFYNGYFAAGTRHPSTGITQALADQRARGPYVVNSDGNNAFRSDSTVVTNATTIDLGPDTKLKNIFGYQYTKVFNASDSDGLPYGVSQSSTRGGPVNGGDETARQVSEELQLQGTTLNSRLTYTAGFYFADQKVTRKVVSTFFDILFGGQSQINAYALTSKTYAGYGQATYKLNDAGLSATLGLRYTSERVGKQLLAGDSFLVANPVAPAGFNYNQAATYNRLSWQVGIQDQLSPETLLYAVTRRAYKSGGFNGTVPPRVGGATVAGDSYLAERVTDVEVGAKFKGRIGTMPSRLSVSLFHNWIQNNQRLAFTFLATGPASLTVNVPNGKTYGGEIEAVVSPASWLSLGGSVNYTNASFSRDTVSVAGSAQIFDQVPDTPELAGSLFADVTVPVSGTINALLHGDVYHQSKTFTAPRSVSSAGAVINGYTLANFRLGIEDSSAGWSLTANLKNAFNQVYYVGGLATGEIFQINTLIPGTPRTFTVEARFKF